MAFFWHSNYHLSSQKSLLSDDYENELELYSVLGFNPVDESCTGKVGIYDNDTGEQIKCFELGMSLDEVSLPADLLRAAARANVF